MIYKKDLVMMEADYRTPRPHRHLALHLLFGSEAPLVCQVGGEELRCGGVCIDSNVCHTAWAVRGRTFVVLVEPTSTLAGQMRRAFLGGENREAAPVPEDFAAHVRERLRRGGLQAEREAGLETLIRTLDGRCEERPEVFDTRIQAALAYIEGQQAIERDIYERLGQTAKLSQSRLSHLFREQVGSSLAGYLAWAKLEKACREALAGESLTRAAVNAGFSSPSHLSATFQKNFGISFSAFLASV